MIPPDSPDFFGSGNGNGSSSGRHGPSPGPLPGSSSRPEEAYRGALVPQNVFFPDGWGPGVAAPARPANAVHLLGLLKAVRRRWFLAFSLALLLGAAAATAAWFFFPPSKYVARTRLHVEAREQALIFQDAFRAGDFGAYQKHQMALVKSRLVFLTALRAEAVAALAVVRDEPEPIEWLERELRVDFSLSPNIMQISIAGEEPEQLIVLVNAVREAYLSEIVNKDYNERMVHYDKLRKYYHDYQAEVSDKQTKLKRLAEDRGLTSTTTTAVRQSLLEDRLKGATKRLLEAQNQLFDLEAGSAEKELKEKHLKELKLSEAELDDAVAAHELIRQKKLEVEKAQAALKQAALSFEDADSPLLAKWHKAVSDATGKLEQLKKELRPVVEKELYAAAGRRLRLSAEEMKAQIGELRRYEALAKADIQDLTEQLEKLKRQSVDTLDMEFMKKELERSEAILKRIGEQRDALKIELPAPARVRTLEEGIATRNQDDKKRLLATAAAGLAAAALALFSVSWLEVRARRINSVDDVSSQLGMRIVGAIPGMPARNWRNWVAGSETRNHYWRRLLTESVDSARTMLLHSAETEGIKVVMISSAVGGEGKTSLASHLSASLARSGRKTLLIDGDIRKPSLHKLFEANQTPGFSEYLREEAEPEGIMQPTSVNGLHLIAAGKGDSQAVQALARDRLRRLLRQVRAEFDFVIVDTSPVLPVADALLVGQHVDGVLFSILRDVSRFPKVYAAYQRLASLGVRILGAVVNGTHHESYGADYYYYYAGSVGAAESHSE